MEEDWRKDFIRHFGGQGKGKSTLTKILRSKDFQPKIDAAYLAKFKRRLLKTARFFSERYPALASLPKRIEREWDGHVASGRVAGFNNQGRRREPTFYVWMQGQLAETILTLSLSPALPPSYTLRRTGGDSLDGAEFRRLPTSDYLLKKGKVGKVRLEVQAGMDGKNRHVKVHKIQEARRQFRSSGVKSFALFFDFNVGAVFVIRLDDWKIIGDPAKEVARSREVRKVTKNAAWEGMLVIEIDEAKDRFSTIDEFMADVGVLIKKVLT